MIIKKFFLLVKTCISLYIIIRFYVRSTFKQENLKEETVKAFFNQLNSYDSLNHPFL